MMSNRIKSVHHHGSGNRYFKTQYQPACRDYWRTPADRRYQAKKCQSRPGSNSKLKLYLVTDILTELMIPTVSSSNLEEMTP